MDMLEDTNMLEARLPVGVWTGVVTKPVGTVLDKVVDWSLDEKGMAACICSPTCQGAAAVGGAVLGQGVVGMGAQLPGASRGDGGTFSNRRGGAFGGSGTPGGSIGGGGSPADGAPDMNTVGA